MNYNTKTHKSLQGVLEKKEIHLRKKVLTTKINPSRCNQQGENHGQTDTDEPPSFRTS